MPHVVLTLLPESPMVLVVSMVALAVVVVLLLLLPDCYHWCAAVVVQCVLHPAQPEASGHWMCRQQAALACLQCLAACLLQAADLLQQYQPSSGCLFSVLLCVP
jgi:hypothetical protein